jgi:hypothetical protein
METLVFVVNPQRHIVRRSLSVSALAVATLVLAGLVPFFVGGRWVFALAPAADNDPEKLLKKAAVDGKYVMLLHQFKAEKDADEQGEFADCGYRNKAEHGGQTGLPPGYWVYVQPYWYIWGDRAVHNREIRAWGPEQATGEPNVANLGTDDPNAWASKTEDGDDEWLLLEYEELVQPTAVVIHETFNPGAVIKIGVFKLDGTEVEAWKGADPTAAGTVSGVSELELKVDFKTNRIKIYLDSKNVAGWNEIDAVGLRDKDGKVQWAKHAAASSTYAEPYLPIDLTASYEERIDKLEAENKKLRKANAELKKAIEELKKKDGSGK